MTFGYLIGELFVADEAGRRRRLMIYGLILTAAFVIIRATNVYGDQALWSVQERGAMYTLLSFLNTTKYPPSLLYVCMTLGPLMIILSLAEKIRGSVSHFFQTFGRVPFFFYILHIYTIHVMSIIYHGVVYDEWRPRWFFPLVSSYPEGYTASLWVTYLAWVVLIVMMYFLCRWFGRIKKQ